LWVQQYDGIDDYTNCGNNSSLNFVAGDFSMGCWVKSDFTQIGVLFDRETHWQQDGWFFVTDAGAIGGCTFYTHQAGVAQSTTSVNSMTANVWHHIFLTRVGATATIFVDGVDATTAHGVHINPTTSTANLLIGINQNLGVWKYKGYTALPEVRGSAPTADQVFQERNQTRHLFGV
jgi:hypothetical protein